MVVVLPRPLAVVVEPLLLQVVEEVMLPRLPQVMGEVMWLLVQ